MMNKWLIGLISIVLLHTGGASVFAQDSIWPRTLNLDNGQVTIYKPKVDKLEGDTLHYRAAMAYRESADAEPVFGAGWFESRVNIDESKNLVNARNLLLTEARFPDGAPDIKVELANQLATGSGQWNLSFALAEIESGLDQARAEAAAAEKLNTQPPDIIYRDRPALLVSMNGEPVLRDIENSEFKAVINTPYPLIYNNRNYYLNVAKDVWYRASNATGPYRYDARPPADVSQMVKADEQEDAESVSAEPVTAANAPEIIVSTKPAELIVTDGPAAFVPLVDDLLVLENSDTDVFMHTSSQHFYTVLAGRWYHAGTLKGPWKYQDANQLPEAFANIPKDSDQADSRVYVAGTREAKEAVLDAEVPQTAAVERGTAEVDVEYDGQPVYAPVDGTDMVYIKNTGSTVLKAGGLFYLVENGVWYVSTSPNGPWQVSDHRPEQVDTILPTSPVYNSKYVHVYESTPKVVYVGYTPGYTGSYVYRNTVFYGTGYYYPAWVSPYYYYPRHSTWGFGVYYNSWSGWSFGLSWGWGPFSVGYYSGGYWHHSHYWHHRHFGYWGPRGYRPRPHHYSRRGNRYAYDNHRRSNNDRNHYAGNDRGRRNAGDGRDRGERNDNLYRDRSQRARVVDSRDRSMTPTERRHASIRQANAAVSTGTPQKNSVGVKKGEHNRAGPVTLTDLRKKAKYREQNSIEAQAKFAANSRRSNDNTPIKMPTRSRSSNNSSERKVKTRHTTQPVVRQSSQMPRVRVTNPPNRQISQPSRSAKQNRQPPARQAPVKNIRVRQPSSGPTQTRVVKSKGSKIPKPRQPEKATVQAGPQHVSRSAPRVQQSTSQAKKSSSGSQRTQPVNSERNRSANKSAQARSSRRKD